MVLEAGREGRKDSAVVRVGRWEDFIGIRKTVVFLEVLAKRTKDLDTSCEFYPSIFCSPISS